MEPQHRHLPDGGSLFVGFYGLPDPSTDNVYVYGATGSISASGPLTLNDTQRISTSSFQPANTPAEGLVSDLNHNPLYYYWGDNDRATADYDNFYYSHLGTTSKTFDVSGTPTNYVESDVYLTTVPISYSSRLAQPSVPGYSESGGTVTLTWDKTPYEGLLHGSPNMYVEYSTPTQPWTRILFNWPSTDPRATDSTVSFNSSSSNFTFNSSTIYYFRLRAQYPGGILGSSSYSSVLPVAASNTMLFTGTSASDTIVLKKDSSSNSIDFTLNNNPPIAVSIISGGSLLVLGKGGDDTITFDLSNGNFLAGSNTIDNDTGTLKLDIVGTTSNDTVSIVGGGNAPYTFDTTSVNVVGGLIKSLEYDDGGGNDTISVTGSIPTMVNLSSGNSTVTNSDSAPVFVAAGTGKTTINATSGTTIIPANSGTGIQQLDFAAINISAGAKVVFANTSSTLGDYSNHANRTLAIVDAGGLNIAPGGTLDLGDNSMILKYLAANKAATDTMVLNLLTSGYAGGAWTGAGINSSEAANDAAVAAARGIGWADQADEGDLSFEGDTADLVDGSEIMIKFTYYGDTNLDGVVNRTDASAFSSGVAGVGTGWIYGDFNYSGGAPNRADSSAFSTGLGSFQQFGAL